MLIYSSLLYDHTASYVTSFLLLFEYPCFLPHTYYVICCLCAARYELILRLSA